MSFSHGDSQHAVQYYHDEQEDPGPDDHEDYGSLPDYVIRGVNRFLFFVGYARSGQSIVASMLDAHPHVVIAHEYSLFRKWQQDPETHSDKHWLFNTLYTNSKHNTEDGLQAQQATKNDYVLAIPGSWQGRYDNSISVIGDKSGEMTAQFFRKSKENFTKFYNEMKKTVQVPISIIHIIRNPYDNIATMLLQKVNETGKYVSMEAQIASYFEQVHSVVEMINTVHLNVIEVHNSDMIAKPKIVMRTLCDKLRISCSEQFLQVCAHRTFSSESKSRHLVKWTQYLIDVVAQNIQKYDHLKRYTFIS